MTNLVLQPAAGKESKPHFYDTIKIGVPTEVVENFLTKKIVKALSRYKNDRDLFEIWGVNPKDGNNSNITYWNRLEENDTVLFIGKKQIFYIAQIAYKIHNKEFAERLWGNDDGGYTWEYMYFLKNGTPEELDATEVYRILGYEGDATMGFRIVDPARVYNNIACRFGNIENMLLHLGSNFAHATEKEDNLIDKEAKTAKSEQEILRSYLQINDQIAHFGEKEALKKAKIVESFVRNKVFSDYVKKRAEYRCEICGVEGFLMANGGRYAEAHHKEELAIRGWDHPDNMICVCPTCHREIHFGAKFQKA
jgi:hypothetical protein